MIKEKVYVKENNKSNKRNKQTKKPVTKQALLALGKVLQQELIPDGVRSSTGKRLYPVRAEWKRMKGGSKGHHEKSGMSVEMRMGFWDCRRSLRITRYRS